MKSHRDAKDSARDPRKVIAQLGTTGDELARTLGLDKDATRRMESDDIQRRIGSMLAALIRDDVVLREINRWRQRAFEQAECLRCVYFIAWDREACGFDGGARTFSGTAALAMSGRA